MFKKGKKLVKIVLVCLEVMIVTEKLNNILFHPSKLMQYRKTNFFLVLLYLLALSAFAIIVPIIDIVKTPELTIADKDRIEATVNFNFDLATDLPDCSLNNGKFSCLNEDSSKQEIGTILGLIKIVSDVDGNFRGSSQFYYIKFTENYLKLEDQFGVGNIISYSDLPSKWQSFDFTEIKNSPDPSDELYLLFIGGLNQLIVKLTPVILLFSIMISFVRKLLEILFYSFFFYLLYRRYKFKYLELFKLTVFAHTFPITIIVILNLLRVDLYNTYILTMLTFIYVYIAISHSIPRENAI